MISLTVICIFDFIPSLFQSFTHKVIVVVILNFFYLAASGLIWGTRDLPCLMPDLLLWCSGPGACRLSCTKACGKLVT